MKYVDNNILRKEVLKSFQNDKLTTACKGVLTYMIETTISKIKYSDQNQRVIFKYYVMEKLFDEDKWKNFNIKRIDENSLPYHYYIEIIKRLLSNAWKNKDKISYSIVVKMKRKERREKLNEIEKNARQLILV